MENVERDIAEAVLAGSGLSAAKLGLRFDRVVGRVLGDLRAFTDAAAPEGVTVLVTISAPIRLPAKTVEAVRERIGGLVTSGRPNFGGAIHGNAVSVRLVREASTERPKLVGFVHNPGADLGRVLDLAERWLLG